MSSVTKSNPTQKCRPAKGKSKRINIQIIKDTNIAEQPNNKYLYTLDGASTPNEKLTYMDIYIHICIFKYIYVHACIYAFIYQ
jgi:hypothetical protein